MTDRPLHHYRADDGRTFYGRFRPVTDDGMTRPAIDSADGTDILEPDVSLADCCLDDDIPVWRGGKVIDVEVREAVYLVLDREVTAGRAHPRWSGQLDE